MAATWGDLAARQPRAAGRMQRAWGSGRLHHAYLVLGGPAGDRRELSEVLAAALVCTAQRRDRPAPTACGHCASCRATSAAGHPDVVRAEANERGVVPVAQVRDLSGQVGMSRALGSCRVVVVPTADAMPRGAQNALLKVLEEPPAGVVFLLATARPGALAPALRSRCATVLLAAPATAGAAPAGVSALVVAVAEALAPGDNEMLARLGGQAEQVTGMWTALAALERGPGQARADRSRVLRQSARLAADWGRDPETCALAESLVALRARDALGWHLAGQQRSMPGDAPPAGRAGAIACADALAWARRAGTAQQQRAYHLERILIALAC